MDTEDVLGVMILILALHTQEYFQNGGEFLWRLVTLHFDDTTEEGYALWASHHTLVYAFVLS